MKITEQEARDLLSAINCYLLCDFGVQDVEMQAQADAEKERILKIQEELKKIVGDYPQIATAREIARHMNINENSSSSFRCFISCVGQMVSSR